MNRALITVLHIGIVLLGFVILAALLWEPWVEGVNANATSLYDIYFDDPFLAYIYVSFIAVFVGLYSAFKLASYVGHGKMCSPESAQSLRTIRTCALIFSGAILVAVLFISIVNRDDDIAGGVAVGLFFIVTSLVVAGVADRLIRKIGKASA